jgi:uncharacterized protein (UPF0254 family)
MLKQMKSIKKQASGLMPEKQLQGEVIQTGSEQDLNVNECNVTVMSGSSSKEFPVANMKIGDIRQLLKGVINIADGAVALVNGTDVSEDHLAKVNDRVEFVKRAGMKGTFKRCE